MPKAQVNGIDLYYEEHGTGFPVLVIHGTSSSALVWGDAAAQIGTRARCIAYDRRGSFRSERPEPYEITHVAQHADDAAALLDALSATPALVIGRSYGGEVALDLARRYPRKVSGLALLEPAMLYLDPEAMGWARGVIDETLAAGERGASVAETFLRGVVGDEVLDSFPAELKEMFIGNGPAILAELRGWVRDVDVQEFAEIDQPVLMVSAKDSPEAFRRTDRLIAQALPNCRTVLVDGGHFINPAHPDVLAFVDSFVAKTSSV